MPSAVILSGPYELLFITYQFLISSKVINVSLYHKGEEVSLKVMF